MKEKTYRVTTIILSGIYIYEPPALKIILGFRGGIGLIKESIGITVYSNGI